MGGVQPQSPGDQDHLRAFLARTPLFRAAPPEALAELTAQLRGHDVASGSVIVRQGDLGDDLYLIESGTLEVSTASGGKTINLGLLRPGDFFGEMALVRKSPRTATVTALTPARLWTLSRAALVATLRQAPAVGDHLRTIIRQRELANALRALQ
ncbi:MAG: cyclic nucleotide-binding domain-containing protein [Thermomicrobiales bacterium]